MGAFSRSTMQIPAVGKNFVSEAPLLPGGGATPAVFRRTGPGRRRKSGRAPKSRAHGDRGHRGASLAGHRESAARQMHPPQPKITHRPHAEMLLTANPDGAFGGVRGGANLRE